MRINPTAANAAIGTAAGVAIGAIAKLSLLISAFVVIFALVSGIIILILEKNPGLAWRLRNFHFLWIGILFIGIGMIAEYFSRPDIPNFDDNKHFLIVGKVEKVTNQASGDRLTVSVWDFMNLQTNEIYHPHNFKTYVFTDGTNLIEGDIISVQGQGSHIARQDSPLQFPVPKVLSFRDTPQMVISTISESIELIGEEKSLSSMALKWRRNMETVIDKSSLNKETKAFITTLFLGDRDYLDNKTSQRFSDAGVSHFIAVSGMHVAIIAGIALVLLLPFNSFGKYKWRYFVAIILVWGYCLISGFSISSVRASIMLTYVFVAYILERQKNILDILLWSIFFILFFMPYSLFEIGFQLSVVCVASLIIFGNTVNLVDHHSHSKLYKLNELILTSIIASLGSWVLISYYFKNIPLIFLPANVLALPFLPLYFGLVLIYFFFYAVFGLEINFFASILEKSYGWFCNLLELIGNIEGHSLIFSIGGISVILWFAVLAMAGLIIHWKRNKKMFIGLAFLFIGFIVSLPLFHTPTPPDGFVIASSFPQITIKYFTRGEPKVIEINASGNKRIEVAGKQIFILNDDFEFSELEEEDLLLITKEWHGNVEDLRLITVPSKIIIHPTVRRVREFELIEKFRNDGIKVHSLRHDGDYMEILNQ